MKIKSEPSVDKFAHEGKNDFALDDPVELERCIADMAHAMLKAPSKTTSECGLWLKYEASTFAAAMADFKRQDKNAGDALQAYANSFIALFGRALYASMSDEDIVSATMTAAQNIADVIVSTVAENCKLNGRQVKMPLPSFVTPEMSKTVH